MASGSPLTVDYYSDVLCVWAWVAQQRVDELLTQMEGSVALRYHCVDVFGDVPGKIASNWAERGGYQGFAEHVAHALAEYSDFTLHPDVWTRVRPVSSANAHLLIKAVESVYSPEAGAIMARALRQAFFSNGQDVAQLSVLAQLADEAGFSWSTLQQPIDNGAAMAALMGDYQRARAAGIKGSPSYVLDGGRQVLFGNVGYRVIRANVEELLHRPPDSASWC
ncbi:DsbA family oxidoreductase [Gilvimarinus agarilyticus]|uniref:DsbA family oxidoreductase n=1 Tax=Gilvimarinus agarilyticus TaxID=679259 RepID=UPI0005A1C9DD|nr:DsbA family protein [Gilvimarinus agarilyticus]